MAEACGSGHLGGSFSVMDVLVALYFDVANVDPSNPNWEDRDRIIFSKAHSCEALYAVLGERGYFGKELFKTFGEWGSPLQGHSERWATPGVEYSGGSLGQGLSYAVGVAYASKLRGRKNKVYCIIGDGECHEGQIWEAAMSAAQYKLDNLTVIMDYNGRSSEPELIEKVMDITPIGDKWYSLKWKVFVMTGNNFNDIKRRLPTTSFNHEPSFVISYSIKGKGVPSWEQGGYHLMYGDVLKSGIEEWRELLRSKSKVVADAV
jgi:transketolase